MSPAWSYFWPLFAAGLVLGGIFGSIAYRKKGGGEAWLTLGFIAAIGAALLWHGPLGAADRFATKIERTARITLDYYEMTAVTARLHRHPLTRVLVFTGPADDFQTSELVRMFSEMPGVSAARWSNRHPGPPLAGEGAAVSVAGFLLGLLLAYLAELRRRHNAQWNW